MNHHKLSIVQRARIVVLMRKLKTVDKNGVRAIYKRDYGNAPNTERIAEYLNHLEIVGVLEMVGVNVSAGGGLVYQIKPKGD